MGHWLGSVGMLNDFVTFDFGSANGVHLPYLRYISLITKIMLHGVDANK